MSFRPSNFCAPEKTAASCPSTSTFMIPAPRLSSESNLQRVIGIPAFSTSRLAIPQFPFQIVWNTKATLFVSIGQCYFMYFNWSKL